MSWNDLAGSVAVDATPGRGDAAVGATSLVGFAVILPAVAEGTPLADCGVAARSTGRAAVFPWPLLGWCPRLTLLGRRPRSLLGW